MIRLNLASPALAVLIAHVMTGCRVRRQVGSAEVDTTLVYIAQSKSSTIFPKPIDSNRVSPRGMVLADSTAQSCAPSAKADWPAVTLPWRLGRFRALAIRLPAQYKAWAQTPPQQDSVTGWVTATWEMSNSGPPSPSAPLEDFLLSLGPIEGYPTIGLPSDSRQVAIHECILRTGVATMNLAQFDIDGDSKQRAYYLAAYGGVAPGLWLRVVGISAEPVGRDRLVAALRSLEGIH